MNMNIAEVTALVVSSIVVAYVIADGFRVLSGARCPVLFRI